MADLLDLFNRRLGHTYISYVFNFAADMSKSINFSIYKSKTWKGSK